MKVKDFIKELKKCNQEAEVRIKVAEDSFADDVVEKEANIEIYKGQKGKVHVVCLG